MKLSLETTTGLLVPAGVVAQLPRGGTQPVELQFLTNGVAGELAGDPDISLALYEPDDLENPFLEIDQWQYDAARGLYTGEVNTLASPLAWLGRKAFLAQIAYGASESANFQLDYGADPGGAPGEAPRIVVPAAAPAEWPTHLYCEGEPILNQLFGFFTAPRAGQIIGAQVSLQTAPTGQAAKVVIRKNVGDVADHDVTLPAGDKTVNVVFDGAGANPAPVDYAAGDILRAKFTQLGSAVAGAAATVTLICRHTA